MPLAMFRIAFGLILFWEICRYFSFGWIRVHFMLPNFHFTFYGFDWVHPWPGNWMFIHFTLVGAAALAICLGFFYRIATVIFFFGFTYIFLLDSARYLNHLYLVCLFAFLLIFVPANRALSIDALLRPGLRSAVVPAWSIWVLRAQLCVVYFMGGIAKLNADWLRGQPLRLWLADRMDFPVIGQYFKEEWMVYAFSYGGLCIDLFIAPLILWRRTRLFAFAIAAFFNLTNARLFHIGIFPWLTLGATILLFADFSKLSRWLNKWKWLPVGDTLLETASQPIPVEPVRTRTPQQRVVLFALGAWLAFQILVPLRHLFLYPGNPEWTEEGHRFSWRMKLRDKHGELAIMARDPVTGLSWSPSPLLYVTEAQLEEAEDRPEMIQQLCRHIAERWQREHQTPLEVRVSSRASLNGRPLQVMIDPEANLAAEPRNLRHAKWIKPLVTPLNGPKRSP